MNKLLAIVGPTSSGKSELAVRLAKRFGGEIISADSRQIYKGMDLGTGKVAGKWRIAKIDGRQKMQYIYKGIVHHLIDFANPKRRYSVALYQSKAQKIIADVLRRGKLPILCGGTAHYIDAVVYNQQIPDVKPNLRLRTKLEKKSTADLFRRLKRLDPVRAKSIDRFNKRRLVRALEIVITTGKPIPKLIQKSDYNVEWVGVNPPQKELYKKIDKRLNQRLKDGMVEEIKKLRRQGVSWKRLSDFGLEYRYVSLYLQKKLAYPEMVSQLSFAIKHYSKRQLTWWKRNKDIRWLNDKKSLGRLGFISL